MANRKRGEASIFVEDQEYVLVFDFNAICALEDMQQRSIAEMFFGGNIQNSTLRDALVVGLKRKHKGIATPNQVGRIIDRDPSRIKDYLLAVLAGVMGATGSSEEEVGRVLKAVNGEEADDDGSDIPASEPEPDPLEQIGLSRPDPVKRLTGTS